MPNVIRTLRLLGVVLALPLSAATGGPFPASDAGWDPCAGVKDPRSLWLCWSGSARDPDGLMAATCVAKTACPPRDQRGKPVLNCYYEKDFQTGFRCLVFCNYGGPYPWGSDGGNNCD